MDPKITTFLMFEGEAEEAITFYTSLFDDSEIIRITKYGADGPDVTCIASGVDPRLFN